MVQMLLYTTAAGLVPLDGTPTLELLQKNVGGYIEQVKMPRGIIAWCDEEGLLKQLPPSLVVEHRDGYPVFLHGPVVFVVRGPSLPEDAMALLLRYVRPIPPATQASSTVIGLPPSTPR